VAVLNGRPKKEAVIAFVTSDAVGTLPLRILLYRISRSNSCIKIGDFRNIDTSVPNGWGRL
jgi:hypothetical protein